MSILTTYGGSINNVHSNSGKKIADMTGAGPGTTAEASTESSRVWSRNEWDPLEEVIVGAAVGTVFPVEARLMVEATMPRRYWQLFETARPFPARIIAAAQAELDNLDRVLTDAGVVVQRPTWVDPASLDGYTSALPRDSLLVVGSTVIEAPMAWRSRRGEVLAYRPLLQHYHESGARWVSAPRVLDHDRLLDGAPDARWAINETQPAFAATDFLRFGRDIVAQRSHVTNRAGIDWLRRHLGDTYRIHVLDSDDPHAMRLDRTIMPLRPGTLLFDPDRIDADSLRRCMFAEWDLVPAPRPAPRERPPLYLADAGARMNVLVIDRERVVVEAQDDQIADLLAGLGFDPIRCPFRNVQSIGGSFHRATTDIRRRGVPDSPPS